MQIFLDADGILADFDKYASEIFGKRVHVAMPDSDIPDFWETIHEHGDFYNKLPLMPDANHLVSSLLHLNPIILTGVPKYKHEQSWAQTQKILWAKRHFPEVRIITCLSANKKDYITEWGDILVDDTLKYQHLWEGAGGVFIHHVSAEESLQTLRDLGVLE